MAKNGYGKNLPQFTPHPSTTGEAAERVASRERARRRLFVRCARVSMGGPSLHEDEAPFAAAAAA
eukprot:gene9692-biopygen10760